MSTLPRDGGVCRWSSGRGFAGVDDGSGVLGVHHGAAVADQEDRRSGGRMRQLLAGLGGVPKLLMWDNESGIGQHHRLTLTSGQKSVLLTHALPSPSAASYTSRFCTPPLRPRRRASAPRRRCDARPGSRGRRRAPRTAGPAPRAAHDVPAAQPLLDRLLAEAVGTQVAPPLLAHRVEQLLARCGSATVERWASAVPSRSQSCSGARRVAEPRPSSGVPRPGLPWPPPLDLALEQLRGGRRLVGDGDLVTSRTDRPVAVLRPAGVAHGRQTGDTDGLADPPRPTKGVADDDGDAAAGEIVHAVAKGGRAGVRIHRQQGDPVGSHVAGVDARSGKHQPVPGPRR